MQKVTKNTEQTRKDQPRRRVHRTPRRDRGNADGCNRIVDAEIDALYMHTDYLRERINDLQATIDRLGYLRERINDLQATIDQLQAQVRLLEMR